MGIEIKPRELCPDCAALGRTHQKDLAVYKDGKLCHRCGYKEFNGAVSNRDIKVLDLIPGKIIALSDRKLNLQTCEKYNIRVGEYRGHPVNIFPIYKNGIVIRQKVKSKIEKANQAQLGDTTYLTLFGQQLFNPNLKIPIIVTEGEEDAAAMWQMTGLPSVSIFNGAGNALKELKDQMVWLSGFKEILLAFDNDEPGNKAFSKCVENKDFEPGKIKRLKFPLKDANEMLKAGRFDEVKKCIWNAEVIKPATIVFPSEIRDKVLARPKMGSPYPWPSMTKATYGMRKGEVILLAAPTSTGKTEFIMHIMRWLLSQECKIGCFSFEQTPEQTIRRQISAELNQRLYLPGCDGWDDEKINKQIDALKDNIAFYDVESGEISLDDIINNIRFLTKVYGMSFFVVDNLKAMATNPIVDGKRLALHDYASHCMSKFVMIAKQLNITIFVVNHLSADKIAKQAYISTSPKNPDEYLNRSSEDMQKYITKPGMDWETGRIATIDNIFGGGNIKDLVDFIIVLARNRMSEDDLDHRTTIVKFLKTRLDSSYEGFTFKLVFNYNTGRLEELNTEHFK